MAFVPEASSLFKNNVFDATTTGISILFLFVLFYAKEGHLVMLVCLFLSVYQFWLYACFSFVNTEKVTLYCFVFA